MWTKKKSDPKSDSRWNCFQFEGIDDKVVEVIARYYFCPNYLDLKNRIKRTYMNLSLFLPPKGNVSKLNVEYGEAVAIIWILFVLFLIIWLERRDKNIQSNK